MNEKELIEAIQDQLEAQTWTGGSNVVFGTGSVLVTASLPEGLKAALQSGVRTPMCLIAPSGAESDPSFDEEPGWEKFTFSCLLAVVVPGGAIGQEPILGANIPDSTKSEGKGILAIEQEFYNAVGILNGLESVFLQVTQRGEEGGQFHPPSTYIAYRVLQLSAWGTAAGSSAASSSSSFSTVKQTGTQTATDGTLADLTGLSFSVTAGTTYVFQFNVVYATTVSTIGLKLGLTFPASTTFAATVKIPQASGSTSGEFQGAITASGGSVSAQATPTDTNQYQATIEGTITPSSTGTLQAQFAGESAGATITAYPASSGFLYTLS